MSDPGRIHIDGLRPADVALLKQVAAEAAEQAVIKTFIAMGIDATKPLDAQADMMFLRSTRQRCESIGFKAIITMMGLVMAGAAGLIWIGFKTSMKSLLLPFVLPIMILLALAAAAFAHEWYPVWCCSGGDCGPLAGARVQLTAHGYLVDGKFTVPLSEARKSMDGRYHGCFPKPDDLKCFFAPPPGS